MSVKIKPENFKPVARLLTQFKPGKVMRGRATIWDRLHRLVASEGQLKLFTTDGLSFLEWIIPHEGHMADAFEMPIDAEQFNNVALKLNDGDFLMISSANEYLTLIQGHRNLRMAWQSATAYPTPEQGTGPPSEQSVTWTYPTAELSKALAFVATFINNNNKAAGRAVATLNTNHELTAGGAAKQASVVGLNATLRDVSLTQTAARQVSAFLGMLSEEVRITADDKHYTFTCPLNAHRLIVPRESPFQLAPLGRRNELDYEQVEVGREALASSTTFLATVVTAKAKPLEFWLRGGGEGAQLKIVTPHQLEAEKSEDTLPVLRTFHHAGEPATTREEVPVPPAEELKLKVDAEPLRGILTDMEGKLVLLKYFPRQKLLLIEEDPRERTGIRRLAKLLVGTITEPTSIEPIEQEDSGDDQAQDPVPTLSSQESELEHLVGAGVV